MKTLVIILIALICLSFFAFGFYLNENKEDKMEEPKFQGPVPEGYDEEHFRKTGETKPLEIE